jgi:two-component system cell cycle response regulator
VPEDERTLIDQVPRTLRSEVQVARAEGRTRRTPTLTQVSGPDRGAFVCIEFASRALFLGRDDACDFVLDDPSVSRRHSRAYVDSTPGRATAVVIQDLGSTNGTLVNGKGVERVRLKHGDRVHVGDVLLRFEMLDPVDIAYRDGVVRKVRDAECDSLTKLLSRTGMEAHLPVLLESCVSQGRPISAVLVDLDHFKVVNDTLGHVVGDEVLRSVGQLLRNTVRREDIAVRYGGEEFLLVLAGARRLHARLLAERIRERLENTLFPDHPGLQVTCSLGVAERAEGEPIEEWFHRTDQALYRAKEAGRNRSEAAPMPKKGG